MIRRSISNPQSAILLAAVSLASSSAFAAGDPLTVKVIHATKNGEHIDDGLEEVVKNIQAAAKASPKAPRFTSFVLKDEPKLVLEVGSAGRIQLPNGKWITVKATSLVVDTNMLKIAIAVEKLDFKATVSIAPGATVVVLGPKYQRGRFFLAITRGR